MTENQHASAATNAEWAASLTADDCVALIDRCLAAQDMEGVVAALRLLAVKDPHEADLMLRTINLGIRLRDSGSEGVTS